MIHRRNIAVAYALAIPIFLVALFVELGTLYKLNAAEGDVVKAMSASNGFDDVLAGLGDAEKAAQGYVASGSEDYRLAFGKAAGRGKRRARPVRGTDQRRSPSPIFQSVGEPGATAGSDRGTAGCARARHERAKHASEGAC